MLQFKIIFWIQILVGFVTISPEQHTKISDIQCNDQNPIEILLLFMSEKNLRLLDLFKSLDKDQSGSLTREEFIDGLQVVFNNIIEYIKCIILYILNISIHL